MYKQQALWNFTRALKNSHLSINVISILCIMLKLELFQVCATLLQGNSHIWYRSRAEKSCNMVASGAVILTAVYFDANEQHSVLSLSLNGLRVRHWANNNLVSDALPQGHGGLPLYAATADTRPQNKCIPHRCTNFMHAPERAHFICTFLSLGQ